MTTSLTDFYRQAESYFWQGLALKELRVTSGAHAYMTGVPICDLNPFYVTKIRDLDHTLRQGEDFYDQDDLSFVVSIPQDLCTMDVEKILSARGYRQADQSVAMGVALTNLKLGATDGLEDDARIRCNNAHLEDWIIPLVGAFGSTREISGQYAQAHQVALDKNCHLQHFSLYEDACPVASSTLSIHKTLARIDDVGTLPEFQRKGYATRLMTATLTEAKQLGARHCFLEASTSGLGLYQKLGFASLFTNNIYTQQRP